jgi:hypothetical protein
VLPPGQRQEPINVTACVPPTAITTLPALMPKYEFVCGLLPPATPQPQHEDAPPHGPQPMQQLSAPLPTAASCTSM